MEIEKETIINCPECGEEIIKEDKSCKHCGSWFKELTKSNVGNEYSNFQSEEVISSVKSDYSNVQPIGRTILFIIITGGFYQIYWFYRNWRDFKVHKNLDISVGLRTIGLFIPLVNLYFIGNQFKDIVGYVEEAGIKTYSLWAVILTWGLFAFLSTRLALSSNPVTVIISWILILGLIVPFVMVQKTLNEYWIKEQGNLPPKGLSGGEMLVLIIGVLLAIMEWLGIIVLLSGV